MNNKTVKVMARKNWKWTVERMGVLEWLQDVGVVCIDPEWWMEWQRSMEGGYSFGGWIELGVREKNRRLRLVREYMQYMTWWEATAYSPRGVSVVLPEGNQRVSE